MIEHKIDVSLLPNMETVMGWQEQLNALGPRLTGSDAHRRLIDSFDQQLRQMGLEVQRDRHMFTRWEAKSWGLTMDNESGQYEELPVASYYPYSGQTDEDGIEGELVYCGSGKGNFRKATGKIAVVKVSVPTMPTSLIYKKRAAYPANEKAPSRLKSPVLASS